MFLLEGGDAPPSFRAPAPTLEPPETMPSIAPPTTRRRRALARTGALALALALIPAAAPRAPAAHANAGQISVLMDDDLFLYRDDRTRDAALARAKALGVDAIRATVLWEVVAENARSTPARIRRFRGEDPATYPRRNWDRYDRFVASATKHGLAVYFNVTGPGPPWAHRKTRLRRNQRAWRPKAREYYKFVAALGKRYSGTYRDENDGRAVLPRVSFWSIWNEPSQGGWLLPQSTFDRALGKMIPESPRLYRELWFFGRKALDDTGHGADTILVGETSPIGQKVRSARKPLAPKTFIREFFCVDRSLRPYTGLEAKARGCGLFDKFGPVRATAWAHHPYTKFLPPTRPDRDRDSITMANIGDLAVLLDRISATGRLAAGMPIVLTEFGYETNPPDRFNGISLARQAEYLNVGDYLAYKNPRVFAQTQFLLRDVRPLRRFRRNTKAYWFTYQSGLYDARDRPKPAAPAYALPFHLVPVGRDAGGGLTLSVWGQLRFRPNGITDAVQLQFRPQGGTTWQNQGDPVAVTNPLGFFETRVVAGAPGSWRALWRGDVLPFQLASREILVTP